jgi:hypothetical protein
MTDAANALIHEGYQIIVPFDSDEFWNVAAKTIDRMCSVDTEVAFFGRWQNFVQLHAMTCPRPFGLFHIRHRAPTIADTSQHTVTAFQRPFVCYLQSKVAFKTRSPVELGLGQHHLKTGPSRKLDTELEIFHVPLRYRSEILKRGLNYEPRLAAQRRRPQVGWQSAFHELVAKSGRVDEVWAANSAGPDGTLNVYGERLPLVPDSRLRTLIIRAWAFSMMRWPNVYLRALQNKC